MNCIRFKEGGQYQIPGGGTVPDPKWSNYTRSKVVKLCQIQGKSHARSKEGESYLIQGDPIGRGINPREEDQAMKTRTNPRGSMGGTLPDRNHHKPWEFYPIKVGAVQGTMKGNTVAVS